MQKQISFGMLDSPSWDIIRTSKLAAQIYAPLGTTMSLGDYVRVCRSFIEVFKWAEDEVKGSMGTHSDTEESEGVAKDRMEYIVAARRILKVALASYSIFSVNTHHLSCRNIKMISRGWG